MAKLNKETMYNYIDESIMQYQYKLNEVEGNSRRTILKTWIEVLEEYVDALKKVTS